MTSERSDTADAGSLVASPPVPGIAVELFGSRLTLATLYVSLLASEGSPRGLIGPREVPRLWDRHVLNCALLADLLPVGARVVDVGSGAGLPGLVLAIRRPDLHVDLVEPMRRRTDFLAEAVALLGLAESVRVVRGRADEQPVRDQVGPSDWVVARAVAPLDRLVRWTFPLLRPGGRLLALKGATARDELASHSAALRRLGVVETDVIELALPGHDPTWVVVAERTTTGRPMTRRGRR